MLATLALAAVPLVPQTTAPYDGLLNGGFEMIGPGKIENTSKPTDGHFWVGAEGRVLDLKPDRVLRLTDASTGDINHLVYQRVGVPQLYADTAKIQATVTVLAGDEARISLVEADGEYWILDWVLRKQGANFFMDCPTGNEPGCTEPRWKCYEVDPVVYMDTDPHEMIWLQNGAPGFTSASTTGNEVVFGPSVLTTPGFGANAGWMELVWDAPKDGWVKVLSRPWTFQIPQPPGDPTLDTFHEIYKVPSSKIPELLRSETLDNQDPNGPIIVERVYLLARDEIRLRVRRNWDGVTPPSAPDAKFIWHPAIVYEGKTFTYRLGDGLTHKDPELNEAFTEIQVSPGVETTIPLQNAGEDFEAAWGVPPRAPLEVRLMAETSTTGVTFDDVTCLVDFEVKSEEQVRNEALVEALWQRQNVLGRNNNDGILDEDAHGAKLGNVETPYAVHKLDITQGTMLVNPPFLHVRGPHEALWRFLTRRYDPLDYQHYYSIRERESVLENLSLVNLIYNVYDAVADEYQQGSLDYTNAVEPLFVDPPEPQEDELNTGVPIVSHVPVLLEQYARTNDYYYLERAVDYALVIANGGAVELDTSLSSAQQDRIGILSGKSYDINNGQQLIIPLDADDVFGKTANNYNGKIAHVNATSALVQTYAAAKIYNHQHQGGPGVFDSKDLLTILFKCDTSIQEAKDVLDPVTIGQTWRPTDQNWHLILGHFQDNWGNQAGDAVMALEAMNAWEGVLGAQLTGKEAAVRDTLRDVWVKGGTLHYFEPWAQAVARYEFNAGDQVRGWIPIFEVLSKEIPDIVDEKSIPTITQIKEQFRNAALNALKYQFADPTTHPTTIPTPRSGFWTSAGLQQYQLTDISPGFGGTTGAARSYLHGLGQAYALIDETDSDRDYIRAAIAAILQGNIDHFKPQVGFPPEDGYGYWRNVHNQSGNQVAGVEGRSIEPLLFGVDGMVPDPPLTSKITVDNLEPGDPSVSPESLSQMGTANYTFTITWPNHTSQQVPVSVMESVWLTRTQVTRWKRIKGSWVWIDLDMATAFGPPTTGLNWISYTTLNSYPLPPSGERAKFTIRTWSKDLRWVQDTSVQENIP